MFCRKCGNEVKDTDSFCGNCGHKSEPIKNVDNISRDEKTKNIPKYEDTKKQGVIKGILVGIKKEFNKDSKSILACLLIPGFVLALVIVSSILTESKYGFINTSGEVAIDFNYDNAGRFSDGLACISKDGKFGFINKKGELVIPCNYELACNFNDGAALVSKKGNTHYFNLFDSNDINVSSYSEFGIINSSGSFTPIDSSNYTKISRTISNGLLRVETKDKLCGFINLDGKLQIPCEYKAAKDFSDGFAKVRKYNSKSNSEEFVINTSNKIVCNYDFNTRDVVTINTAVIPTLNSDTNKYGYVNTDKKTVIPFNYNYAGRFTDKVAVVNKNDKFGAIDISGNLVIPCAYESLSDFSNGFAIAQKDAKTYIISNSGQLSSPCNLAEYKQIYPFNDEVALVYKDNKYGAINTNGELVVPCIYDACEYLHSDDSDYFNHKFNDGLLCVKNGSKYGFINTSNKLAIPYIYSKAYDFSEGLAPVSITKLNRIINSFS